MRLQSLVTVLLLAVQSVWAAVLPEHQRLLVVFDDSNADVDVQSVVEPLSHRGYSVSTAGVKEHPLLMKYGLRLFDGVVIIPGRVKALGSTLRRADLLEFLQDGGSIVALTTPKYSPLALRDLSNSFGIEVGGRGVEFVDSFNSELSFPHPNVVAPSESSEHSSAFGGAAVAKLGDNDFLLGLVQCPYSSYSWNAAKAGEDVREAASDVFSTGGEGFLAAGIQSLSGSRFVWVGSPKLLTDENFANQITKWAFGETGQLRLNGVRHQSELPEENGASHQHYMVEEPLKYCANVEKWNPETAEWEAFENVEDVQLEFKMLDPYYRLNLDRSGCASFIAPQQYGMFTFHLSYKVPGYTFLEDKKVVTIRHRANDEWDRSWAITNSWVYLAGVSTTVFGFILFCVLYLTLPSPYSKSSKDSKETKVATTSSDSKEAKLQEPKPKEVKDTKDTKESSNAKTLRKKSSKKN